MLTDATSFRAWAGTTNAADALIDDLLAAAQAAIARKTGRELERPATPYVRLFDGDEAHGRDRERLLLDRSHRPVIHSGGDLVTVTENGVALDVVTGYTTTGDAVLAYAGQDRPAELIRRPTALANALSEFTGPASWAGGRQNIEVSYLAGWTSSNVPADVVTLIHVVAHDFLRSPQMRSVVSRSKGGHSVSFARELDQATQSILDSLTVH